MDNKTAVLKDTIEVKIKQSGRYVEGQVLALSSAEALHLIRFNYAEATSGESGQNVANSAKK